MPRVSQAVISKLPHRPLTVRAHCAVVARIRRRELRLFRFAARTPHTLRDDFRLRRPAEALREVVALDRFEMTALAAANEHLPARLAEMGERSR